MKIPFVDLIAQYNGIKKEVDRTIFNTLHDATFIGGEQVIKFERNFARLLKVQNCISVGNGTDALFIALKCIGIGPGDEVITVANSWISSSETISQTGAKPVFVDIEKDYYTINPAIIEEKITEKTKAILPVHIYGQMADMKKISALCKKHSLWLLEDCAQAHFSEFNGKCAGTFGIAGTFSFYPAKNLGAYGDGGAIITNNNNLATKMRMFANHGGVQKHQHEFEGINSRLDGIQAAVLNVKLKYIQKWTQKRIENARRYTQKLQEVGEVKLPTVRVKSKHTFHLYVIRAKNRDQLRKYLADHGVSTQLHYPVILPLLPAYAQLNYKKEDFPVSGKYQEEILSLPMYPELTFGQIDYITDCIKAFYAK